MEFTSELIVMIAVFFVAGGGIVTGIIMGIEVRKHRPVKSAANADHYIVMDETQMKNTEDTFLRTHTTKVKVASSNKK